VPPPEAAAAPSEPPEIEVVIEVPRGSFLKRGCGGRIAFVSPLPCPFNYGAVPAYVGLEGDLLDALVLGPRLPLGAHTRVKAWGAVTLIDRGMEDDKLICSHRRPSSSEVERVLRFFAFYARCKKLLNWLRRRPGRNACGGLRSAEDAIGRASPLVGPWTGPRVPF
jgi:inorganic pyrophosphatase